MLSIKTEILDIERRKKVPERNLTLSLRTNCFDDGCSVLLEAECTILEEFWGYGSEPGNATIDAFLWALENAKVKVGDSIYVNARKYEASKKRYREKTKKVRCKVLAIKYDSMRNLILTHDKSKKKKAYLFQETGVKDFPLNSELKIE